MNTSSLILGILTLSVAINLTMMLILYASAWNDVKIKWRFHRARRLYRQSWITPRTALWLAMAIGAVSGSIGIALLLLAK